MMTTPLQLTTGDAPGRAPRVTAVGEIDISNVTEFATELAAAVGPDHRVVVDLTRVDYLDSAALAVLFAHADRIEVHVSSLHESLLTVCGLTDRTMVSFTTAPGTE